MRSDEIQSSLIQKGADNVGVNCWGCRAELAEESPTELHLARRSFTDNIAIYILHCFAGRDGPNGW
jgi:hypothetical protein